MMSEPVMSTVDYDIELVLREIDERKEHSDLIKSWDWEAQEGIRNAVYDLAWRAYSASEVVKEEVLRQVKVLSEASKIVAESRFVSE